MSEWILPATIGTLLFFLVVIIVFIKWDDRINKNLKKKTEIDEKSWGDPSSYSAMFIEPQTKGEKVGNAIRDIVNRGGDPEDFRIDFVDDQVVVTPKDMEINWEDKGKSMIQIHVPEPIRDLYGHVIGVDTKDAIIDEISNKSGISRHILDGTQRGTISSSEGRMGGEYFNTELEKILPIGSEKPIYINKRTGEVSFDEDLQKLHDDDEYWLIKPEDKLPPDDLVPFPNMADYKWNGFKWELNGETIPFAHRCPECHKSYKEEITYCEHCGVKIN